jgi:formylglycine-generating enzyme required for sulfatase activity
MALPTSLFTMSQFTPFWIGQYEVTNAEYDLFKKKRYRGPQSPTGQHPVIFLSWYEANDFCRWLSKKEKRKYRLPTEAEWEYAARGGLEQKTYPWGNEAPEGRATLGVMTTTPVGAYPPNGFSLYDVAGNIHEWVSDWYAEDYYVNSPTQDPQGPPSGESKVTRGGPFMTFEIACATRYPNPPDMRKLPPPYTGDVNLAGFRVALDAPVSLANQ